MYVERGLVGMGFGCHLKGGTNCTRVKELLMSKPVSRTAAKGDGFPLSQHNMRAGCCFTSVAKGDHVLVLDRSVRAHFITCIISSVSNSEVSEPRMAANEVEKNVHHQGK